MRWHHSRLQNVWALHSKLANHLLKLAIALCTQKVVAATDVLAGDENVRHSALARLLLQVVLHGRAVVDLIQLESADLAWLNAQTGNHLLRALAENRNRVLRNQLLLSVSRVYTTKSTYFCNLLGHHR